MFKLFKKKKAVEQAAAAMKKPINKAATTQAPITQTQEKDFEKQRKLVSVQKTLEQMKLRVEENHKKVEQKQNLIKSLIREKKKAEAQRHLSSLKALQEELTKMENMIIMLEKSKIQLESTTDTGKVVDALRDASSMNKEMERNKEYLEDYMVDKKEMEAQNAEIGQLLNDIAVGNPEENEEIDDLYQQYEHEVLDEKIQHINKEPVRSTLRPVDINKVSQSIRHEPKKVETQSIDDLLMQMAH